MCLYLLPGYTGAAPSSMSSMSHSVVAPPRGHNFLDDSSQLDDILKELLGEQGNDTSSTLTRQKAAVNEGSITTHSGNSRTIVSWQTAQSAPQRNFTTSSYSMQRTSGDPKVTKDAAFSSYGAHSTSHYEESRRTQTSSNQRVLSPSRFSPARIGGYQTFEYLTDGEQSWLQEQQQKLQSMKDQRDMPRRNEQERKLVAELKSAQSTLTRRRAQSEAEEDAVVQQYAKTDRNVFAQNGPTYAITPSPTSPRVERKERTEKNYFVSGIERPPFTTHQTKYTFSVSPPQSGSAKPPVGRYSTPSSPIVPVRGNSSHEAVVRTRTISTHDHQTNGNDPLTPSTSAATLAVSAKSLSQYLSEQTTTTPSVGTPQVSAELQAPLPKPPEVVEEPIVKAVVSRKIEGNSAVRCPSMGVSVCMASGSLPRCSLSTSSRRELYVASRESFNPLSRMEYLDSKISRVLSIRTNTDTFCLSLTCITPVLLCNHVHGNMHMITLPGELTITIKTMLIHLFCKKQQLLKILFCMNYFVDLICMLCAKGVYKLHKCVCAIMLTYFVYFSNCFCLPNNDLLIISSIMVFELLNNCDSFDGVESDTWLLD